MPKLSDLLFATGRGATCAHPWQRHSSSATLDATTGHISSQEGMRADCASPWSSHQEGRNPLCRQFLAEPSDTFSVVAPARRARTTAGPVEGDRLWPSSQATSNRPDSATATEVADESTAYGYRPLGNGLRRWR